MIVLVEIVAGNKHMLVFVGFVPYNIKEMTMAVRISYTAKLPVVF